MKIIQTIVLSTSLLGLAGCATTGSLVTAGQQISQQIKKKEKADTFKANAAKPITAAERAAFPAETGLSGAFRIPDNDNPSFLAIEPDATGNNPIVWIVKSNFWNGEISVVDYAGVARPNAIDFNYDGYRATITYNPRRDSIRLSTNRNSTERVRASYEEFYVYTNGLGY